ncbi:zinc finger HIT domain-containing protein 2 [Leptodactylus fuscus]|uniref:zinc finger HIT domain-containing protein 2 n=1 Tax=Leptodactylus fuscus TaxID=238119 RepID=UPI003F4E7E77
MEAPVPDIALPGRASSPTPAVTAPSDNGGPAVCALCLAAPGKYTCPRCNAPYCSLACYKGARHSACSELFYREAVLQALQEEEGTGGRREMEEMLLKLREEEEEPVAGLISEEESGLWSSLSRQEREHFSSLLQSGHIGSLVPQWKPWWERHQGSQIVELPEQEPCPGHPVPTSGQDGGTRQQTAPPDGDPTLTLYTQSQKDKEKNTQNVPEHVTSHPKDDHKVASPMVNEKKDNKSALKEAASTKHGRHRAKDSDIVDETQHVDDTSLASEIPPLLSSIPPLCSLTRNPSPLIRFTLVNVIYGYSFSLLRHNGDLSDDEMMLEFIGTVLSVSGALSTTTVYNSTPHALKSAVRAASDPLLGGDEGVAVLAMEATAKILLGDGSKTYSLAALSHLYRLLGKSRKLVMEEKDMRKGAFSAKKKCSFLAAWVTENGDSLAMLSAEVMMEYKQYLKDLTEMAEISKGLERVWGGKRPPAKKKLIEEVN